MEERPTSEPPLPVSLPGLDWTAKEVVRELHGVPRLLVRVTLTGMRFIGTSPEEFVRIGRAQSRFAQIDEDGMHLHAYFDADPPEGGGVEFGRGRRATHLFPSFNRRRIERLDRDRLPRDTRIYGRAEEGEPL